MAEQLAGLFRTADGTPNQTLEPLRTAIETQRRPRSALIWLRNPKALAILQGLSTGTIPLTREAFAALPSDRTTSHIAALLEEHGLLSAEDHQRMAFERWTNDMLQTAPSDEARVLLTKFTSWHHLRRMRKQETRGPIPYGAMHNSKQQTAVAAQFLTWLSDRGRSPSELTQADTDAWLSEGSSTRYVAGPFVTWAVKAKLLPRVKFPRRRVGTAPAISHDDRISALRMALNTEALADYQRVAATMLLLYAQPLTRVAAMRLDQVTADADGACFVDFGGGPVPLPHPFCGLMSQHLAALPHMSTAAHASNEWLFPGRRPGQHVHPTSLMNALRAAGVPLLAGRHAALEQLVREMPPVIAAKALGYHVAVAERYADAAGRRWGTYAALPTPRRENPFREDRRRPGPP